MNNLREKYRQQLMLITHVYRHYFLKKRAKNDWVMCCWLGKEPTGQLFTIKSSFPKSISAEDKDKDIKRLANDMWGFLFTEKGEQIIRKEHDLEK